MLNVNAHYFTLTPIKGRRGWNLQRHLPPATLLSLSASLTSTPAGSHDNEGYVIDDGGRLPAIVNDNNTAWTARL